MSGMIQVVDIHVVGSSRVCGEVWDPPAVYRSTSVCFVLPMFVRQLHVLHTLCAGSLLPALSRIANRYTVRRCSIRVAEAYDFGELCNFFLFFSPNKIRAGEKKQTLLYGLRTVVYIILVLNNHDFGTFPTKLSTSTGSNYSIIHHSPSFTDEIHYFAITYDPWVFKTVDTPFNAF